MFSLLTASPLVVILVFVLAAVAMAAIDFGTIRSLPVVGPVIAKKLDAIFGTSGSDAHDHDGSNSKRPAPRSVEAHTAADTLTAAESGSVHTNLGATGAVALTLPPATVGLEFFFQVQAAQELRIDPNGTETISLPSSGVAGAAGKYLVADAVGETVHLMCCKAGTWGVMGYTGTWTAEA